MKTLLAFVVLVGAAGMARGADGPPDLTVTPIAGDGQISVSFDLSDGYTPDVRDAIHSGLLTTFTYELDLRRGAALFDRTVASVTVTAVVRFDNLTRRYQMWRTVDGRVEDARPTEDQDVVRAWMTHFERVPLSATTALEPNGEYYVRVRAQTRPRNAWPFWPWGGAALGQAKFTFVQ
jgi:hypothetical protein